MGGWTMTTMTTAATGGAVLDLDGGEVKVFPIRSGEVRLESDRFTVNGVDYRFTAFARLPADADRWEVTYLGGERTPWASRKDFGFTPSAKKKIRSMIPDMLSEGLTEDMQDAFAAAEAERRRLDEAVLERQKAAAENKVSNLEHELWKLRKGYEYTAYPNG